MSKKILTNYDKFVQNYQKIFRRFFEFSLNFPWHFLKFVQKLPSAFIFMNCTNLSKFIKIIWDSYLNFNKLSTFLKLSEKQVQLQNFKFFVKFTLILSIIYSRFLKILSIVYSSFYNFFFNFQNFRIFRQFFYKISTNITQN